MREHADIPGSSPGQALIVGGGLVGASLAIALDAAGCSATLVEAARALREVGGQVHGAATIGATTRRSGELTIGFR